VFFAFPFQISFPNMTLRKIHIPHSNLVLDAIPTNSRQLAQRLIRKSFCAREHLAHTPQSMNSDMD
jgi:hypothetical protein